MDQPEQEAEFLSNFREQPEYKVLEGTINEGHKYESLMCSYVATKLLINLPHTQFQISTNVKGFEKFDDIVVELNDKNYGDKLYAIQLKHSGRKDAKIKSKDLSDPKGMLNPLLYYEFNKTSSRLPLEGNITLVLYTNKAIDKILSEMRSNHTFNIKLKQNINLKIAIQKVDIPDITFPLDLVTDPEHVYKFVIITPESDLTGWEDFHDFKKFCDILYFCSDQANAFNTEEKVKETIKNEFFLNDDDIVEKYLNFFEIWSNKKEKNFKLSNTDILLKMIEILLKNYVTIITTNHIEMPQKTSQLLSKSILEFKTTICEEKSDVVCNIWDYILLEVENSEEAKRLNELFNFCNRNIDSYQTTILKWALKKLPLIIKMDEKHYKQIEKAINFSQLRSEFKFVVIDESKKFEGNNCFRSLFDLQATASILYEQILENFTLTIEGRGPFNIQFIFNEYKQISSKFKVHHLFKVLEGNYKFGEDLELPSVYIHRRIDNVQFYWNLIDQIQDALVIVGNDKVKDYMTLDELLMDDIKKECKTLDWLMNYGGSDVENYYILVEERITNFDLIINKNYPFHYLEKINDDSLEWIYSHNAQPDLINKNRIETDWEHGTIDSKIINNFCNPLNLFLANPGVGKSVLLTFIQKNCPLSYWPMIIKVREHCTFLKSPSATAKEIIDYFLENSKQDEFINCLKQIHRENKTLMFLWDGIDEFPSEYLDPLLEKIKTLSLFGYKQFLASREHLQDEFIKYFNVSLLKILDLTVDEQNFYLSQKLKILSNNEMELNAIENKFKSVADTGILSIPLLLYLFTEVLLNRQKIEQTNTSDFLSLVDIYEEFIDGKLKSYLSKGKLDDFFKFKEVTRYKRIIQKCQKVSPLALYGKEFCEKNNLMISKEFLEDMEEEGYPHGILINITKEGLPIFFHQTAAEYFFTQYLVDNWRTNENLKEIAKNIFNEKNVSIRYFFNLMLAKGHENHTLLLLGQYDKLMENKIDWHEQDKGGRTLLHLACSMGETHPILHKRYESEFYYFPKEKLKFNRAATYEKLFQCLVDNCDINAYDELMGRKCLEYAEMNRALYELNIVLSKNKINYNLKILDGEIDYISYYHFNYDYPNLLKQFKLADLLKVQFNHNKNLINLAIEEKNLKFLTSMMELEEEQKIIGYSFLNDPILDGDTPLTKATLYGFLEIVKLFFTNPRINLNSPNSRGDTALHVASSYQLIDIVRWLLDNGADVNLINKYNCTPLVNAVSVNNFEIIQLLSNNVNFKLDACTRLGADVLHKACYYNNIEIVRLLVEKGVDVNSVNCNGKSALIYAFSLHSYETVEFLLDVPNINVNVSNKEGKSLLFLATEAYHIKIINSILMKDPNTDIDLRDHTGNSALHVACRNNCKEIVHLLLSNGADVNLLNYYEYCALIIAYENNNLEIVQILLNHPNIDVNLCNCKGHSALHLACQANHLEIARLILSKDVDINLADINDEYPLTIASERGRLEIVKLLLSCPKIDVNLPNIEGDTALHLACRNNHIEIVKLLVQHSTEINVPNRDNKTPLNVTSDKHIIEFLTKNGAT